MSKPYTLTLTLSLKGEGINTRSDLHKAAIEFTGIAIKQDML
jgi:hypothetical protein